MPLYEFANNGKFSGRQDGNVMMRNGRSRGMTVPALVRNAYTSLARGSFSSGSSAAWAALTDAERISWNNASGIFVSDRFGHPVALKGKELYVRCFTNCALCGTVVPNTFPDLIPPLALTSLNVVFDDSAVTAIVDFDATPIPANIHAIVYCTAPKRPTIYRPSQSAFRMVTNFPPTTATGADIATAYNTKFGAFTTGQRIFTQIKMIDDRSGFESARVQADSTVVA